MRLRTLPVSLAGVVAAMALAAADGELHIIPAILCLIFALLAQIASNFANEYFDYRDGLDTPGRDGPRRGVTEGDLTPRAMLVATIATLAAACIVGLTMTAYAGWWIIIPGILIALGAMAYSAGPYPLSRHALGEVAVILFFGLIPVGLGYTVISGYAPDWRVIATALGIGLLGANVLIVNNLRDAEADAAVGKTTLATLWGRPAMIIIYLLGGVFGILLTLPAWLSGGNGGWWWLFVPAAAIVDHFVNWLAFARAKGRGFNPILGRTSILMAVLAIALLLRSIL